MESHPHSHLYAVNQTNIAPVAQSPKQKNSVKLKQFGQSLK